MANKFYNLYGKIFGSGLAEEEVHVKISGVQSVARQYSPEYAPKPLPFTDPALDQEIRNQFDFTISLEAVERQSLVNLLVTYHDLSALKPWGQSAQSGVARPMMW